MWCAFWVCALGSDGPPEDVLRQIKQEFTYQSSLDLGDDTFELVRYV